jgi:hypothetical protein
VNPLPILCNSESCFEFERFEKRGHKERTVAKGTSWKAVGPNQNTIW